MYLPRRPGIIMQKIPRGHLSLHSSKPSACTVLPELLYRSLQDKSFFTLTLWQGRRKYLWDFHKNFFHFIKPLFTIFTDVAFLGGITRIKVTAVFVNSNTGSKYLIKQEESVRGRLT